MKYFKCLLSLSFMVVLFCTACSQPSSDATDATDAPDATYTVTYVDGVDGAEIAVPSDTTRYKAGDSVTINFTGVGSRTGYTFAGWSDGTTSYTSGSTTTFTMGNANVTLTAQWQWNNSFIGTKASTAVKEVGDIVFNDGSAMPYTTFATLDTSAKNEKKTKAIALIFYKGTGLNSDTWNNDGTWTINSSETVRTLGVGLKHNKNELGLAWCRWTDNSDYANAYDKNITTIQCPADGSAGALTFTGDKNGSDNLEQIATYLTSNSSTDDTATSTNYPAFYFAKNYSTTATNLGTNYASGWYLPSIAELFQIYKNGKGTNKAFDIDAASQALGGDKFGDTIEDGNVWYYSSSQSSVTLVLPACKVSCVLDFSTGGVYNTEKCNRTSICCIRAFD